MNWISVNDRLPDKKMNILVLIGDKIFQGESYFNDTYTFTIWDPEKTIRFRIAKEIFPGVTDAGNIWHVPSYYKEPSHWMPLPELPKEK